MLTRQFGPLLLISIPRRLQLLAGLLAACSSSGGGPVAPPDTGSPLLEVRFPTAAAYDRDGDGLVDLEVAFADSLTGVDPGEIRVAYSRTVKGPAGSSGNLLEFWRVERADSTGIVLEETTENLLPRGAGQLVVTVEDRAGNTASRQIPLVLPPAARHRIVDLQAQIKFNTGQVTIGPGGRKAYVTTEEFGQSALSIVDLSTFEVLNVVRSPIDALSETVVDAGRNRLYLVSIDEALVGVFDLGSEMFLAPIGITSRGIGAALSEMRDRLYIGLESVTETSGAFISVVDPAAGVEERVIDLGLLSHFNPFEPLHMLELLLPPGEVVLYAATGLQAQEGILVIDPDRGELITQIDVWPEDPVHLGDVLDLAWLSGNLFATNENHIAIIPPSSPERIRFGDTAPGLPLIAKEMAVAPSGGELALTTGDAGVGYKAVQIMSAGSLHVVWQDSLPATAVSPQGIAYRPDGNVFMTVGSRIDRFGSPVPAELTIYLSR